MSEKPILFNTEMVRAILEGRKTVTRRLVKFLGNRNPNWTGYIKDGLQLYNGRNEPCIKEPPCKKGDLLYVRETWCRGIARNGDNKTIYKADIEDLLQCIHSWHPSIHMPKKYARIWLRVTDVHVEKLQDIKNYRAEGIQTSEDCDICYELTKCNEKDSPCGCDNEIETFADLWDSTIKKGQIEAYGWDANPWVWVIEFERVEGYHGTDELHNND